MSGENKSARLVGIVGLFMIIFPLILIGALMILFNSIDTVGNDIIFMATTYSILSISVSIGIILVIVSGVLYFVDINKPKNKAKKLLYERYVKGEINKEEFEQMKTDIED